MTWLPWIGLWPILGGVAAGAAIGLEREWRGSAAGLRTHILVSLASTLLMLSAVRQLEWFVGVPHEVIRIDPVRMAHGILTGIGFLGAGVIFREGPNIRGLTTAASLWITAVLGMLFGVGLYGLAAAGTVSTLVVLGAVSITEMLISQRRYLDLEVRFRPDDAPDLESFQSWLKTYHTLGVPLEQHHASQAAVHKMRLKCSRYARLDDLTRDLKRYPGVICYSITHNVR